MVVGGLILTAATSAGASVLVWKDSAHRRLIVLARLNYSSSELDDASVAKTAVAGTKEIERMWNEPQASVNVDGTPYRVVFEVESALVTSFHKWFDTFAMDPYDDKSCATNFIDVRELVDTGDRSNYDLDGQEGIFYTSDQIGTSTTAAHEFGHAMGLNHPADAGQWREPVPGIMFPRGTFVKSQFQWDPKATFTQKGGTLNPIYRHVRAVDVQAVGFQNLNFNDAGLACVGAGQPIW